MLFFNNEWCFVWISKKILKLWNYCTLLLLFFFSFYQDIFKEFSLQPLFFVEEFLKVKVLNSQYWVAEKLKNWTCISIWHFYYFISKHEQIVCVCVCFILCVECQNVINGESEIEQDIWNGEIEGKRRRNKPKKLYLGKKTSDWKIDVKASEWTATRFMLLCNKIYSFSENCDFFGFVHKIVTT